MSLWASREPDYEPPDEPLREPPGEPLEPPREPPLNERQKWIVAEYLAGRRPTRRTIEKAANCSRTTATRDLRALRSLGLLKHG